MKYYSFSFMFLSVNYETVMFYDLGPQSFLSLTMEQRKKFISIFNFTQWRSMHEQYQKIPLGRILSRV